MIAEMTGLEDLFIVEKPGGCMYNLKENQLLPQCTGQWAYLLGSIVPAHCDVMCTVSLGRDESLEDLAYDGTSCVIRVDQMDVITCDL